MARQEDLDKVIKERDTERDKWKKLLEGELCYCTMCGNIYPHNKFYEAVDKTTHKNNKMHICSDCLNKYCNKLLDKNNGDYKYAIFETCKKCNIIYSEDAYEAFQSHLHKIIAQGKKLNSPFGTYKSKLSSVAKQNGIIGGSFADTVLTESIEQTDKALDEMNDLEAFWGAGLDDNDYKRLNAIRADYNQYEQNTPVQRTIIKAICQSTLRMEKAATAGNSAEYGKIYDILSKQLNDGNLKPVQESGANATEKTCFGVFMKKLEVDHPIPDYPEENRIVTLLRKVFMGHLGKLLGFKTPFDNEYDEYIDQYAINIDEVGDE